jgi:hypothetical protein
MAAWTALSSVDTLVTHLSSTQFQAQWNSYWPHWSWSIWLIVFLLLAFFGVWEGSYRHSKEQGAEITVLYAKLQEIDDAKPHIVLRNAYTERVNVNRDGVVLFVANVLRVKLENISQNHYPNNEAKGVIAKISFYDSSGNLLISDMDGRWTDSTQPVGPHWQSVVPLLETGFRIGAKHDLDIAFRDTSNTYIETMNPGFVALNNDNFRFQGWKNPGHILVGERFVAKIRISAVWVSTEFSVEFWAMPHAEIGFLVR